MSYLKNLLFPQSRASKKVRLNRSILLAGVHHEAGEVVAVDDATAADLIADGTATPMDGIDRAAAAAELEVLVPPPVEPAPLPESWQSLPPAFAAAWKLCRELDALIQRRTAIHEKLLAVRSPWIVAVDFSGVEDAARRTRTGLREKVGSGLADIGPVPAAALRKIRHLEDALERAEASVRDWRNRNGEALLRAEFAAGDHLQRFNSDLAREISELHATALKIFRARVEPLGLAEANVARLFAGSADHQRYCQHTAPACHDVRVGWFDHEVGSAVTYIDASIEVMANRAFCWERLHGEVKPLLAQAKKELSRTKAAALAASAA